MTGAIPRPEPRALLLDFGGTLDAPGLHWSTQIALAFEAAGLVVERTALDRAFLEADRELCALKEIAGLGLDGHVRFQVERMLPRLDLPREGRERSLDLVVRRFVERSRHHLAKSRELLGALRTRRIARLGLVSNFTRNLHVILREEGLAPLLDAVLCSEEVGLSKPDPALFRLALDRLGGTPEAAVMIGDSLPSDIMPAKGIGLGTVWIRGDRVFGRGDERAADAVARSLEEALDLAFSPDLGGAQRRIALAGFGPEAPSGGALP